MHVILFTNRTGIAQIDGNLVKHASGGELIVQPIEAGGVVGLEILVLDRGPGMEDVSACMRDGFSTSGTPGHGLGAVARLSDVFDLYSRPSQGTALLSRVWLGAPPAVRPAASPGFECRGVSVAKSGEPVCGDGWAVEVRESGLTLLVVDGLGHGAHAADAAAQAVQAFRREAWQEPQFVLDTLHRALRATRGAAAAIAQVDASERILHYTGVGNISGTIATPGKTTSLVSYGGIVGHQVRKIQQFSYPWPPQATLVMHSDGIATQWRLDQYPGIMKRDPALTAALLYRDFKRGRDDATVVVACGRG